METIHLRQALPRFGSHQGYISLLNTLRALRNTTDIYEVDAHGYIGLLLAFESMATRVLDGQELVSKYVAIRRK